MTQLELSHAIKDPVHGTMQFSAIEDRWIKPFIDSPNFQRLRHIKQLGMADFIFPGAVHTRFNHSLGCCYVASQISHKIGLPEEERQLVIIACLLHDMGHGPFSHTFEDIFSDKLIRHEAWTPFFLADFRRADFFEHYNLRNPDFPLSPEKFTQIESMIMHKPSVKRLLADIVSSQLDSDRLDYLLRDSHFCGVRYGEYDFWWMLNCMTVVHAKGGQRLGVTHKGIGVVEHYLMARRLMTRNIYHYQKKLALEFFLIQLLKNLSASVETYPIFSAIKATRLGAFLAAANRFNASIKDTSDVDSLKQAFLTENYADYRELFDYDIFAIMKQLSATEDDHPAAQIAKRIERRDMPKIIRLDDVALESFEKNLSVFKKHHAGKIQDWQLAIIKSPHQSYTIEEDPILVTNEVGLVRPINELSLMIHAISDKYENTAFLCVDIMLMQDVALKKEIMRLIEKETVT